MKEARENSGCDRHLFGLYCIAKENHIPLPELFTDPSYVKRYEFWISYNFFQLHFVHMLQILLLECFSGGGGNFVLSTSLVGYTPVGGGVAPMCLDGYGIFYNICPDRYIMRWKKETNYLLLQMFNFVLLFVFSAFPSQFP